MPYNAAFRECYRALEKANEHPSDVYIVQSIQLQRSLEDIHSTFQYDVIDGRKPNLESIDGPLDIFERSLKEIKQSFPLPDHEFFRNSFQSLPRF